MDVPKKTAPRLFLIDAYALIYRSFFAFISRPLTNARGENTSAPFGFANFLFGIRDDYEPDYIAVVFDSGVRGYREEVYPEYKATREKMPPELRASLPKIREMVAAFGDEIVSVDGWEADDVIGTLAKRAREAGLEAVIVSGDKDFYQLVGDGVHLLNPGRGGPTGVAADWVDERNASDKFGVRPERVVDYLALVGDSSDNVPGAPGIGPKTALKLLNDYETVEGVLEHAPEITAKRARESLIENRDQVLMSKDLVTIRTDLDLDQDLERFRVTAPDRDRLRELFVDLEFRTLLDRLAPETGNGDSPAEAPRTADYETVTDPARLDVIAAECEASGTFGVAFLNRTLQPTRGRLAGVAVSPSEGKAYYLPVGHEATLALALGDVEDGRPPNLPDLSDPAFDALRQVFANPSLTKVGHDLKASLISAERGGVTLAGAFKDVQIASYVLDPGRRHQNLEALATDFLGYELTSVAEVMGSGQKRQAFGDISAERAAVYACQRAEVPLRLWARFQQGLEAQELLSLFDEFETPLIAILAEMEQRGIEIDPAVFAEMSVKLEKPLGQLREQIQQAAGMEFNINSVPQLREVLFERLKLPVLKKTKTGPSTDSSVLEELAADGHELPSLLMEYRELEKLRNTYVEVLPTLVNPETRRIHTTFNQAVAATGRLSSSDPNLQNIPIRTEIGREIRRGFVARKGALLLAADYSQIELRVLAHFSGDEVFVRAFKENKDVHRETAAVIFDVPVEEVTAEMRGQAKTVNFATLYGQGAFSLARQLGISRDEAKVFIEQYFERFSGVREFLDQEVARAKERGYVETLVGRRRYVPELHSKNWNVRQFGERIAQNTPIQGTAADLIKVAMIRVHEALAGRADVDMLLQVHDELVFEVSEGQVTQVSALVVAAMESAMTLNVPIRVDVGSGRTWYDCKG